MANFLDILAMGLQGAGGMAGGAAPDIGEDIMVTGKPLSTRTIPQETRSVKAQSKRQEQQDPTPELIKRKGRFGVGGTLRDILGTVGDAYLISNGRAATYEPQRNKERLASAQYGFTDDPNAAIERVGELDADAARDLFKVNESAQATKGNLQSQRATREAGVADKKYKMQQDFSNYAGRLLQAADTPERTAQAMAILTQRAAASELDMSELGIPVNPNDDQRRLLGAGDMSVNQQQQLPLAQQRVAQGQQNANANTVRANRPPQGRAAPNPTTASMIAPIVQKIQAGKPLTPGEQQIYNDLKPSRGKAKRTPPPLPPGFK